MAYNVEQLINLQNQIGSQPVMPDAMDRHLAMKRMSFPANRGGLLSMLEEGGQPQHADTAQALASKGRFGDTMLMHVNPEEVQGIASMAGGLTINPETGLPEAFWAALPFLAKAAIVGAGIGAARKATGGSGSWLQNILGGAGIGLMGGAAIGPAGLGLIGTPAAAGAGGAATTAANVAGLAGTGGTTLTQGALAAQLANPTLIPTAYGSASTLGSLVPTAAQTGILSGANIPLQQAALQNVAGSQGFGQFGLSPQNMVAAPSSNPVLFGADKFVTGSPTQGLQQQIAGSVPKAAPQQESNWLQKLFSSPAKDDTREQSGIMDKIMSEVEDHPYRTGATALTLASLLPSGEEEEYEVPESTFGQDAGEAEFIKKDPRVVRADITEEEADRLASEGGDYGFFSQTASNGGIVGLYTGGNPSPPPSGPKAGGHPGVTNQRGRGRNDPKKPPPPVEEVAQAATPFQSRLSSFNVDDILARIGGAPNPESILSTPRVPLNIPQQTSAPIDNAALASLLERASNLPAVQPIIQEEPIQVNTGGLLSILSNREQRNKFDPVAATSPIYALKEDKYPEYYMPWEMMQGLATGGEVGTNVQFATGGEFEGRVQGQGDGMSDQIAFNVVPQTPADIPNTPDVALLSTDEYVVPADVVSMLGNGSSTAGAKMLDGFNQVMRRKAHGTNKQQTEINAGKELSRLT
jgi:hypothetical protein